MRAVAEAVIVYDLAPPPAEALELGTPDPAALLALALGAAEGRRTTVAYRDRRGATTARPVDP